MLTSVLSMVIPVHYNSYMEQLMAFEMENSRLQKELALIHERNQEHLLFKRTAEEAGKLSYTHFYIYKLNIILPIQLHLSVGNVYHFVIITIWHGMKC